MGRFSNFMLVAGIFVLSVSVIFLELLSMRLMSFMLWHHLAYMVLSVAMLGFGASGAWLAFSTPRMDPVKVMTWSAFLFGATCILGFVLLTRVELDTFELGLGRMIKLGLFYAVLMIPYFFAGLAMVTAFRTWPERTTTLYAVNLAGSGLGCWAFMAGLPLLGGPGALVLVSLMGALAGCGFAFTANRRNALVAGLLILALGGLIPLAPRLLPFRPAASKSLSLYLALPGARIEYTRWTPLSRIDVVYAPRAPHPFMGKWIDGDLMRTITIDGDANTWMFSHPSLDEVDTRLTAKKLPPNTYALAFMMKPSPSEVLVIGAGGGNEVAIALAADAGHVTGVELNSAMLEQTEKRYADFFGRLYQSGRATPVVAEGRSFVRRSGKRYDVIQMSGVDTWSGLSTGAYVLSENYLYTVEAAKDMIEHLAPGGLLSIGRFRLTPPRETLRLLANAMRAMQELGWERPEDHVMVVSIGSLDMARMFVKTTPFEPGEVEQMRNLLGVVHHRQNMLWYAPYITSELPDNPFIDLVEAVVVGPGAERAFHASYPYDVTPVYDDRPFFFEYYKWENFVEDLAGGGRGGQIGANRPIGLYVLGMLLAQVSLLCSIFIFGPLLGLRRRGVRMRHGWLVIGGFGALGLGFMFVEVGLMQKLVLPLGHPTYSISVSLFAILVGSGLGSLIAGRVPWPAERLLKASILTVAVIVSGYAFLLDLSSTALFAIPTSFRGLVCALLVGALAVPMGMPFPLSLARTGSLGPAAMPWAWGINGGASVLGSILCVIVAISLGFRAVLLVAACLYLLALPCLVLLSRRAAIQEGEREEARSGVLPPRG